MDYEKKISRNEAGISEIEGKYRTSLSYTLVHPYRNQGLEEMHHIGIIYDVILANENYILKIDGDDQDSLGSKWFDLAYINHIPVTPFVEMIVKRG